MSSRAIGKQKKLEEVVEMMKDVKFPVEIALPIHIEKRCEHYASALSREDVRYALSSTNAMEVLDKIYRKNKIS